MGIPGEALGTIDSPPPFGMVLTELATNMHVYDVIQDELAPLRIEEASARKVLEGLNLGIPAEQQPEGMALTALRAEIAARKIGILTRNIDLLDGPLGLSHHEIHPLVGMSVDLCALDPTFKRIAPARMTTWGLEVGYDKYEQASGKIVQFGTSPAEGGHIAIKNWLGRFYFLTPLIRRVEDRYEPAVQITPR